MPNAWILAALALAVLAGVGFLLFLAYHARFDRQVRGGYLPPYTTSTTSRSTPTVHLGAGTKRPRP